MSVATFRDTIKDLSPTWLRDGFFERYMYAIALGLDLLAEKTVQAVHMSNPILCDPSALPTIGADRLVVRGVTELESRYRQRLQTALEDWRRAGSDWEVLRQALHILLELRPAARTVAARYDRSVFPATILDSKWNAYAAGDDADAMQPTRTLVEPGNWDWDSVELCDSTGSWSRIWIVIESIGDNAWCERETRTFDEMSDGTTFAEYEAQGRCWDLLCPPGVTDSLWNEILQRKAANANAAALIVSFDASHFDPAEPAGGGINPDGTFGRWSQMSGNVQVPARATISDAVFGHRIQ